MPAFKGKYTRILSIDGGGIRGVIPAQILVHLEQRLQEAAKDPGVRLADYFDMIAGTSTGGILTCLYLAPATDAGPGKPRPRFSAADAVDVYLERGDDIFSIPLYHRIRSANGLTDEKYPKEGIEDVLGDYSGDLKLADLLEPCLIPAYETRRRQAFFFTQHDAKRSAAANFYVRDVARATSAAPTYFEAARVKSMTNVTYSLVDGGVFAGNPALCAYAEARSKLDGRPTAANMVIFSLGTGTALQPYHYEEIRDWGLVQWARPIFNVMLSGVSETVDYQLRQMFDAVGHPEQYVRLDPDLSRQPASVLEMDNARTENLALLKQIGTECAENKANARLLDSLVQLLLTPA